MPDTANLISPQFLETGVTNVQWVLWEGVNGTGSGVPIKSPKFSDKTVHFFGTWGGATFVMQGSNDPRANPEHANHASADWITLTDAQGNAISKTTTNAGEVIEENYMWIRPLASGGTGTDMDIAICGKRVP